MNKTLILLILVVALGGGSVGLYLHQQNVQEQQRQAFQSEKDALEREQERLNDIADQAQQKLLDAQEATRLAEAKAAEEAKIKENLVSKLNERLKKESAQREAAEKAFDQLEEERAKLALAQEDLETRLAKLEAVALTGSDQKDYDQEIKEKEELVEALEAQEARMVQLAEENDRIKQEYEAAIEQQLKTAAEIVNAGGKPVIPNPTIRSLNDRRRNAVYLKERGLGTINKDRAEDSDE